MDIHATGSVKAIIGGMSSEKGESMHFDFE
jgi:hypothetical protein